VLFAGFGFMTALDLEFALYSPRKRALFGPGVYSSKTAKKSEFCTTLCNIGKLQTLKGLPGKTPKSAHFGPKNDCEFRLMVEQNRADLVKWTDG
jgi:hypothetical protein